MALSEIVLIQNEQWGSANFAMATAMGGFRLWTTEDSVDEARELIASLRPPVAQAKSSPGDLGAAAAALFLGFAFGPMAGFLVAGAKNGKTKFGWAVVAIVLIATALLLWKVLFMHTQFIPVSGGRLAHFPN